jgi:hypothetical protein
MLFDDRKKQDPTRGTGYVVPAPRGIGARTRLKL